VIIPIRTWLRRAMPERRSSAFQPEDGLDVVFGGANPNPARVGCPGDTVIRGAARGALPLNHPVYDHLASCSECYRESRALQASRKSRFPPQSFAAAAVVLTLVAGGVYVGRNRIASPSAAVPKEVVLDYQNEGVSRSETGDAARRIRTLPHGLIDLTLVLPTGSEAGRYEIRLLRGDGKAVISTTAAALMEDFALQLHIALDLRSLEPGQYTVQTRSAGEDWDSHLVVVQ
jgi:hypothetical protein